MSEPELCDVCRIIEGSDADCSAVSMRELTCRDELELYRDGIHAERARVRRWLAQGQQAYGVHVIPHEAIAAILSGAAVPFEAAVAESGKGEVERG